MSMVINTNTAAMVAQAAQAKTNKAMDTAMERLSTGQRINAAADDAAGLAIATRMEANVRGMNQAIRNASDAQSLIDTMEGAQDETMNLMQRIRELAVQSANDTNSAADRQSLHDEVIQLRTEIDRIAATTTWAGQKLLDGTFAGKTFQIGAVGGETISVNQNAMNSASIGEFSAETTAFVIAASTDSSTDNAATKFTVTGKDGSADASFGAGATAKSAAAAVNADTVSTGVSAKAHTAIRISFASAGNDPITQTSFSLNGGGTAVSISATVTDKDDLSALLTAINSNSGTTLVTAEFDSGDKSKLILRQASGDDIVINDFDADDGTTENQLTVAVQSNYEGSSFTTGTDLVSGGNNDTRATGVVKLSSAKEFVFTETGGGTAATAFLGASTSAAATLDKVSAINISTRLGAQEALSVIDKALEAIASSRGELGAVSNRIDSTVANLTNIVTNTESSRSRIVDADFAAETSNLTKAQILSQAATAMLAQANASKQSVLSLLQG